MKITVNKEHIEKGVVRAVSIIPAKSGISAIRSLWLKAEGDKLNIMSSDGSMEFFGSYQADIIEEGMAGIQGHVFLELMRKLPSGVFTLEKSEDSNVLSITTGRKKFTLPLSNASWFQGIEEMPAESLALWSGDMFLNSIERTEFCIEKETETPGLASLQILPLGNGTVRFTGANSFSFALYSIVNESLSEILPKEGILIQKFYLGGIKKWLSDYAGDIELCINDKRLFLRKTDENETVSLPLCSSSVFPSVNASLEKAMEKPDEYLAVDRKEFATALERATIFSDDVNPIVKLDFLDGEFDLQSSGQEKGAGKETLTCTFNGETEEIRFQAKQLISLFGHFKSPTIKMNITGDYSPCGIHGDDDEGYIVVISPVIPEKEEYYTEDV